MYRPVWIAALVSGLAFAVADAKGVVAIPFEDGLWHGGIGTGPDGSGVDGCWAGTTSDDGTTLSLSKRMDAKWYLQLSNPGWVLPALHRYDMVVLVDFYPKLRVVADAKNPTLLEIADLDRLSLLTVIENGHTIDLESEGFHEKYSLEGSAKIIQRIRTCFAGMSGHRDPAGNGP